MSSSSSQLGLSDKEILFIKELVAHASNALSLVGQHGRAEPVTKIENSRNLTVRERIKLSLGRDSSPRPLPLSDSAKERNLTKVTLYQAELPRQSNGQSSQ
jgi:hypothetical protein